MNLDFNSLMLLECYLDLQGRELLKEYTIPSIKDLSISKAHQHLVKEGYLVTEPGNSENLILSVKGKELWLELPEIQFDTKVTVIQTTLSLSISDEQKFEEWWKLYPRTGTWETDDKVWKFTSSRNLKNLKKEKARDKYLYILNQGFDHDQLIGALKYEIKLKKLDSVKKKANQMEYFKGMESYLNMGVYMEFIEEYKSNPGFILDTHDIKGKKLNVTDI